MTNPFILTAAHPPATIAGMDASRLHTLTFAVKPAERADGGALRFEGVAYSGGVVPACGWHGDVVIDLESLKNADGEELPVLVDHQASVEAIAGKGRLFRFTQPDGTTGLRASPGV
ncbi:hypothetical protein [Tepidimonas sp.]|uniref:hypothetical protein n=1 Tax=Tepidimonas sp. TaxID=2002775 RepID=UPI002FE125AD